MQDCCDSNAQPVSREGLRKSAQQPLTFTFATIARNVLCLMAYLHAVPTSDVATKPSGVGAGVSPVAIF